jgi:hypothetical protein
MFGKILSAFGIRKSGRRKRRGTPAPYCVVSHPKSGRTWLRVMLDDLGIAAEYTHAGPKVKGWMHYEDLTTELPHAYDRILVLTRDPRDSTVSGFHQMTKRSRDSHKFHGTMSAFVRDPRLGILKAAHFNLLWGKYAAEHDNTMVVSYEEMKKDTVGVLLTVARFFGLDPNRAEVEEIVARNEFSRMQQRERSGELGKAYGAILAPSDPSDTTTYKVRRGTVGSHADELTPEDIAYCESALADLQYFERMRAFMANQHTNGTKREHSEAASSVALS